MNHNKAAEKSGSVFSVMFNQRTNPLFAKVREIVIAFCDIAKHHNIEVEDDATIFTRYKNGATGTFKNY